MDSPLNGQVPDVNRLDFVSGLDSQGLAAIKARRDAARQRRREAASDSLAGSESPLSFMQERLLYAQELEQGAVHPNDALLMLVNQSVSTIALRSAIMTIADRHEVLRSAIVKMSDGWMQRVVDRPLFELSETRLPNAALDFTDETLLGSVKERMARPLALDQGVTFRVDVFSVGVSGDTAIAITVHHLVCDLWSLNIFGRELQALYNAHIYQHAITLPEIPLQYKEYAIRQRQEATTSRLKPHLDFWRNELIGAPPVHQLPLSRPRSGKPTFAGSRFYAHISPGVDGRFKRLCRSLGLTLHQGLMAAFQWLVARESGEDEVVILSTFATRDRPELENLIGCFLNLLPLRLRIENDKDFDWLANQVKSSSLEMWQHRTVPFQYLIQEAQLSQSVGHHPISQLACVLQNAPTNEISLGGARVRHQLVETGRSRLDLTLWAYDRGDGLDCEWEYNVSLFDEGRIQRMHDQFVEILNAVAEDPGKPLYKLTSLSEADRRFLVTAVNKTTVTESQNLDVISMFRSQVEKSSSLDAFVEDDKRASYSELDRNSDAFAGLLARRGVTAGDYVGVCLQAGLKEVTSILAILKLGAIYVPIPFDGPRGRREKLIDAVSARIVITSYELIDDLWKPGRDVMDFDDPGLLDSSVSVADLLRPVHPDNAAYVMFTSGSTGDPKGVEISHRGFANRMAWGQRNYPLNSDDTVLRKAESTFDVSMDELFRAILFGARCVQMLNARPFDAQLLAWTIKRYSVTDIDISPTGLAELTQPQRLENLGSLRRIVSGVSALSAQLANLVQERLPGIVLYNVYGPTEVSISCTSHRCIKQEPGPEVPIGLPMDNVRVFVLGRQLELLPVGVPGELYVGGIGLALGYIGDPELTAARFPPSPFTVGERLYSTGDRVRWNSSGELIFLGRMDQQLNVRGYRVEPGEIVSVLMTHPEIADAVVMSAQTDLHSNSPAIVAYCVSLNPSITAREIKKFLRAGLPYYMIPTYIVIVERLLLTANGKVDFANLPTPSNVEARFLPPRSRTESLLAEAWEEVLGHPVSVDEDFFAAGGDSILATVAMSKASELLGAPVRAVELFENPNLDDLAQRVDEILGIQERGRSAHTDSK